MNDFLIGTCIYNRTKTLKYYMDSLLENTNGKFHIEFIVNHDEMWKEDKALEEISAQLENYPTELMSITVSPNCGLLGYNIALNEAKLQDFTPILLCNDDTVFTTKDWDKKLLQYPNKSLREGKEVNVNSEKVGFIGPTYQSPGSMRHQQYSNNIHGFNQVDFLSGHATLVTKNALNKNFEFDPKYCEIFGPFDIFLSMWTCYNELNTYVNHDVCFDFPNSQESHFHEGDYGKFTEKLKPMWDKMQKQLEEYQKLHIAKHGFNKWYYE